MVSSSYTTPIDTPKALSIATLIVYIILIQPLLYVFYRHGLRSWLAWLPLQSLCAIRIVGSALQLQQDATHTPSSTALILNNVGLAPLLLAALGILHMARTARNPNLRNILEWALVLQYHMIVVAGMVLVVIGVSGLTSTHPQASDTNLPKVGVVLILVCWLLLVVWTAVSFRIGQSAREAPAYQNGTKLLYGVLIALPFIGIREMDATLSNFVTSPAFLASVAVKVCLSVIPEMIAAAVFIVAGFGARDLSGDMKRQKKIIRSGVDGV